MGLKSKNSILSSKTSVKTCIKYIIGGLILLATLRIVFNDDSSESLKGKFKFDEVFPTKLSWDSAVESIKNMIANYDNNGIEKTNRNIVLIHVGKLTVLDSFDVFVNNMKIFCSAIPVHSIVHDTSHHAFFLFNVVGGESNPLFPFIPLGLPHVAAVDWNAANSDMDTHIRTVKRIDQALFMGFSAVVFLNQGVRGPLTYRSSNQWIGEFRRLLDSNNVGIVGSTISCELAPHVQTHIFVMKASNLHQVLFGTDDTGNGKSRFSGAEARTWQEVVKLSELALSTAIVKGGQNMSTLLYYKRTGSAYFDGKCISAPVGKENPTLWCELTPQETIFMKWGGEPLRTPGLLCEPMIERMRLSLEQMALDEPSLGLLTPETLFGGNLYDLYRQYGHEKRLYRENSLRAVASPADSAQTQVNSKVCFLVRTASMHDSERLMSNATNYSSFITYGVRELAESLIAQRNPNWLAFVFKTDPSPFGDRLQEILSRYEDDRLLYVAVADEFLPQFTKADAGYSTTDHVMRTVLHSYPQCRWVSATNGDNAYGSGVVDAVMTSSDVDPVDARPVNMLLAPIDSRNFAEQDYDFRKEKHFWFKRDVTRNKPPKRSLRSHLFPPAVLNEWNVRCEGVRANMEFNQLAYVIQPRPRSGKVDLAAVFYRRSALLHENMYFGNFTNPEKYTCLGCQDGYLTEYLVRSRLWSYLRLPIDGLQSVVFHGPSPTLCIASGNVWFDHPHVDKVGCYSRKSVLRLHKMDGRGKRARYDWNDFYTTSPQICLRLGKYSFPIEPVTIANK